MPNDLHIRLGTVIEREYDPVFFSDALSTSVSDLGFRVVDSVWQTDLGGDPVACGLILADLTPSSKAYVVGCGTRTEIEWAEDALAILEDVSWAPAGLAVRAHRWFLALC